MRQGDFYTSIGEGHTIAMMLYLKSGAARFTDLIQFVNNTSSLRNRLERMDLEGLIHMELRSDGHKHFKISLTEKGDEVSRMLSIANRLVKPELSIEEKSLDMKNADPILRTMYVKGEVHQKDIMAATRSYDPARKVLEMMVTEGLVICSEDREVHLKLV